MSNPLHSVSDKVTRQGSAQSAAEEPPPNGISPAQHAAMKIILGGGGMRAAADAAQVHRGTVHRWLTHDLAFRRALEWEQDRARHAARREMIALVEDAASVVRNAVRCGDVHASLAVMRNMGLLSRLENAEAAVPAEIVKQPDEEE